MSTDEKIENDQPALKYFRETIEKGGEPAFPVKVELSDGSHCFFNGLSIRDYFAAQAMTQLVRRAATTADWESIPADAYGVADAMLRERAKSKEQP